MICPELNEGDLLIALNAGAYGKVSASTFNGFAIPKTVEFVDGNNQEGGRKISKASIANLLIIILVLGGVFFTMTPENQNGYSSFMEIMIGAVAIFIVVTIIRMIKGNRKQ